MKYAFYPGCSLEVNAAAYDVSSSSRPRASVSSFRRSTTGLLRAPPSIQPGRADRLFGYRPNLALVDPSSARSRLPVPPASSTSRRSIGSCPNTRT